MKRKCFTLAGLAVLLGLFLLASPTLAAPAGAPAYQQADATETPAGPTITVPDEVNLRAGPDVGYEKIGVLIHGQTAPAIGRSAGGDWIQIRYVGVPEGIGWVYAPLVILDVGSETLPIVEPPSTSTPLATPTIDPTLAARFTLIPEGPTRLPTFTPAPPVALPTLIPGANVEEQGGFPPALAIIGLFVVGMFGMIVSLMRRR